MLTKQRNFHRLVNFESDDFLFYFITTFFLYLETSLAFLIPWFQIDSQILSFACLLELLDFPS